jgi:hypothetical protein
VTVVDSHVQWLGSGLPVFTAFGGELGGQRNCKDTAEALTAYYNHW